MLSQFIFNRQATPIHEVELSKTYVTMHYDEPYCQLCEISFAIARLRRADEPKEAGWDFTGFDYVKVDYSYEADMGRDNPCGKRSGCTASDRGGDRPGEHLAGPRCISRSGYSGHRISLAEMKGCRAVQCLVMKDAKWMPEDDDQCFELEGDYFLSGIGYISQDMTTLEDIKPVRHGIKSICITHCVCFSSASPLLQSWANDGPYRTLFCAILHASNYTKRFARCTSVGLTLKACSVRVL